jgi:rhodanese-related sulfurtransferase
MSMTALPQIQPAEAAADRDGFLLLDVREADEWQAGHIDGAVHIALTELGQRLDELDPAQPIVAVCRSGNRSGQVTQALRARGFDVTNLDGGMQAWARAGLPVTTDDGSPGRVL